MRRTGESLGGFSHAEPWVLVAPLAGVWQPVLPAHGGQRQANVLSAPEPDRTRLYAIGCV